MITKQILRIAYFTEKGKALAGRLVENSSLIIPEYKPEELSLSDWTKEGFELHLPILFIGSVGIAVRTIAPFVTSKLSDSAVIVIDELGENVIPVLSGHFGGANEWARQLAKAIDATAVITTATDINNVFAVDVFAKENGLVITDKSLIKQVSKKALEGKKLDIVEKTDYIQIEGLKLLPKKRVLGIGCKKGKTFEELHEFLLEYYEDELLKKELYAICSIDVKAEEIGLIKLSQYYGAKFLVFSADELESVQGDFIESDFVKDTVGIGNVCERAALLGAGTAASLAREKIAKNGMTLAEATRNKIEYKW